MDEYHKQDNANKRGNYGCCKPYLEKIPKSHMNVFLRKF